MTAPIPEGGIQRFYLSDDALSNDDVAAREIHKAIKTYFPRFVILPRGISDTVVAHVVAVLRTDLVTGMWGRWPEFYSLGRTHNVFELQNELKAIRPTQQWQHIREYLNHSDNPHDHSVADAISDQLAASENAEPDVVIALSEPRDWLKRVERAEAALRSSTT